MAGVGRPAMTARPLARPLARPPHRPPARPNGQPGSQAARQPARRPRRWWRWTRDPQLVIIWGRGPRGSHSQQAGGRIRRLYGEGQLILGSSSVARQRADARRERGVHFLMGTIRGCFRRYHRPRPPPACPAQRSPPVRCHRTRRYFWHTA